MDENGYHGSISHSTDLYLHVGCSSATNGPLISGTYLRQITLAAEILTETLWIPDSSYASTVGSGH
jgi:hypothetical protein